MVIYLPLVYIQKNNILFRFRKALFMKDILKYIGTILGIIFLLIIVIDFATYTWPNEPDSITLLFYKNRYWVFLFSVICAIIIKAEAVISYFLVILTIVSFVLTAIYEEFLLIRYLSKKTPILTSGGAWYGNIRSI